MPSWVADGAIFALRGQLFRVVAVGTSNRGSAHFYNQATASPLGYHWSGLPSEGSAVSELASSLKDLFSLPTFTADELTGAMRVLANTTPNVSK